MTVEFDKPPTRGYFLSIHGTEFVGCGQVKIGHYYSRCPAVRSIMKNTQK